MKRFLSLIALLGAATAASAHTGHDTTSFAAGLVHPLGLDHLLAMVAVGVWSAAALRGAQRLAGPGVFLLALTLGAAAGAAGVALPFTEVAVAASVLIFGLMLAEAKRVAPSAGLALVAVAAALHGLAHGAELPAGASFAGYALGFGLATAALHAAGLSLGGWMLTLRTWAWRLMGAGLGVAGLMLMLRA